LILLFYPFHVKGQTPYYDVFQISKDNEITGDISDYDCVRMDQKGYIWISSLLGLSKYDGKNYQQFLNNTSDSNSISSNNIEHIAIDSKGLVWIATRYEGACVLDPTTEKITRFSHDPNDSNSILSNQILSNHLFIDKKDRVYFAHPFKDKDKPNSKIGFSVFDPTIQAFKQYETFLSDGTPFGSKVVIPSNTNDNLIYLGGEDLKTFDIESGEVKVILDSGVNGGVVSKIYFEGDSIVWFGKYSTGLNKYILKENKAKIFFKSEEHPMLTRNPKTGRWIGSLLKTTPIPNKGYQPLFVTDIYPISDTTFLLASYSIEGLHIFNKKTETFSKLIFDKSLVDTDINLNGIHIFLDNFGRLWITTRGAKANNRKKPGIYVLDPIIPEKNNPPIRFSELKINEELQIFDKKLAYLDTVQLKKGETSFKLSFVFLNYSKPENNVYTYFLKNYDEEWHTTNQENNFAAYQNLSPGTYTLIVKASNTSNSYKNDIGSEMTIIIPPFWYQTLVAKILFILLGLGVLFGIFTIQKRRIELKARLQYQEKEAAQLREMDKVKSDIYTNITHEFRTPLTVIQGMAENILIESKEKELIIRNSKVLLRLVNQMLDLAKVESGKLELNWIQDDIISYLHYLTEAWSSYANNKNLHLNFHSNVEELVMDFDEKSLETILSNLISNAIKFTPEYGKIMVVVEKNDEELLIKIKDSGRGISKENLSNIFERFYRVNDQHTQEKEGTGVGLALVKELVNALDGKIEVQSEVLKGTTFIIYLPIQQKAIRRPVGSENNLNEVKQYFPKEKISPVMLTTSTSLENKEILIIEDNLDVAFYIKSILKEFYQIAHASNGKLGLEIAQQSIPDLILCDVMMPVMNKDYYKKSQTVRACAYAHARPIL